MEGAIGKGAPQVLDTPIGHKLLTESINTRFPLFDALSDTLPKSLFNALFKALLAPFLQPFSARNPLFCFKNLLVRQHFARLLNPGTVGVGIFHMILNNLREIIAYRSVVNVF